MENISGKARYSFHFYTSTKKKKKKTQKTKALTAFTETWRMSGFFKVRKLAALCSHRAPFVFKKESRWKISFWKRPDVSASYLFSRQGPLPPDNFWVFKLLLAQSWRNRVHIYGFPKKFFSSLTSQYFFFICLFSRATVTFRWRMLLQPGVDESVTNGVNEGQLLVC